MKFRQLGVLFLVLVVTLGGAGVGCGMLGFGGDGGESEELGLLEFDSPPPTPEIEELVALSTAVDPELLMRVQFLYEYQVRVETFERVVRDLSGVLEYSNPGEVDLDWVIEVHEVTEAADDFFGQVVEVKVPEPFREEYDFIFIGLLKTVQMTGYGSDRVLAASVLVGPGGRSLADMDQTEVDEFLVLMRQARLFSAEAEKMVESQVTEIGRLIGNVDLE